MKLLYVYFKDLVNNKDIEITLSSEFKFTKTEDINLTIEFTKNLNHIPNFFLTNSKNQKEDRITVTGIIGENGTGKTSILNQLMSIVEKTDDSCCYLAIYQQKNGFGYYTTLIEHSTLYENVEVIYDSSQIDLGTRTYADEEKIDLKDEGIKCLKINGNSNINHINILEDLKYDYLSNEQLVFFKLFENYKNEKIKLSPHKNMLNSDGWNNLFENFRHYDDNLITNFLLLNTRISSNVLNDYFPDKNIAFRPFTLNEYCKGDYSENEDIKRRIRGERIRRKLTKREEKFTLSSIIKNTLLNNLLSFCSSTPEIEEKNTYNFNIFELDVPKELINYLEFNSSYIKNLNINYDLDLLTHLILDYMYTVNKLNIKQAEDICKNIFAIKNLNMVSLLTNLKNYINNKKNCKRDLFIYIIEDVISIYNSLSLGIDTHSNYYTYDLENYSPLTHSPFLLKYFKIYNKFDVGISDDTYFYDFPFSSGELHMIKLISSINVFLGGLFSSDKPFSSLLLLLDEPDTSLHPNWQRKFWNILLPMLEKLTDKEIQVIFASHSPILISDIPKMNLNILTNKNQINDLTTETFSSNIYDLYKTNFFLESPIGEFALTKIKVFYDFYKETIENNSNIDPVYIVKFEKLINIIGEPIFKKDMKLKLNELKKITTSDFSNEWHNFLSTLSDDDKKQLMQDRKVFNEHN